MVIVDCCWVCSEAAILNQMFPYTKAALLDSSAEVQKIKNG